MTCPRFVIGSGHIDMNVLVLNCGSSSLKFQIIETDFDRIEKNADLRLAKGLIERIGSQRVEGFGGHRDDTSR